MHVLVTVRSSLPIKSMFYHIPVTHVPIYIYIYIYMYVYIYIYEDRGGTVIKVLCCKSEGRWFYSSWYDWNFSLE